MRRFCLSIVLLLSASSVSLAQTMTISGTIRGLDGVPLDKLLNFSVTAFSGGRQIATGRLVTNVAPFVYKIDIDANQVDPNDVRILLAFRATGRDNVDLDKVVGKAANLVANAVVAANATQAIDIVMPEAVQCYPHYPLYSYPCYGLSHSGGWRWGRQW